MISKIRDQVQTVSKPWADSPYYEIAENQTSIFWNKNSLFRQLFNRMDHSVVLELACGWGRHTEQCLAICTEMIVMDVFEANLERTKSRFSTHPNNLRAVLGDGFTFRPIENLCVSAIFCYDAMVHFSPDIVSSYLKDSHRVLQKDGMALLHHSNYEAKINQHYGRNPHARNHMPFKLFKKYCEEANLEILASKSIQWGDVENLDRISLLQKK